MAKIIKTYEANTRMMKQNSEMFQKILRQVKLLSAYLTIVDEGEIMGNGKVEAKQDELVHQVFDKLSTPIDTEIFDETIQDRIGGSNDVDVIINSIDSCHDLVIATDVNASYLIRGVFTECGVDCDDESSAMVTDHTVYVFSGTEKDYTLIASDDFIKYDLILGSKEITTPVIFPGIGNSRNPVNSLVLKFLSTSPSMKTENKKASTENKDQHTSAKGEAVIGADASELAAACKWKSQSLHVLVLETKGRAKYLRDGLNRLLKMVEHGRTVFDERHKVMLQLDLTVDLFEFM
ncbi:hypothetical protein V6N12_009602 [Hibiscus sabdariffa]|uniref:Uncharacterized protein n=1 Tax=Hibiscus sabdariffa TaxID=183260 RepID=A0ABR2B2E5_9ROSI